MKNKRILFAVLCIAFMCLFSIISHAQCTLNSTGGATDVCLGGTLSVWYGSPDPTESWTTTNASVATVAAVGPAGLGTASITGVGLGSCVIRYWIGSTLTCTLSITVRPVPSVNSITGTLSVCVGSTTGLSNSTPGGVWSSSNGTLASVNPSSGIVTGNAAGSPTISYTVSNAWCSNSDQKVVVVNALPTPFVTGASNVCYSGSPTETLNPTPSGGSWTSSNPSLATVGASSGIVTGVNNGTLTITYTYTDANGCSNTATHAMTVDATPAAGTITGVPYIWIGGPSAVTFTSSGYAGGVWSSSLTPVATVGATSGLVTGVSVGSTTISFTDANTCGTDRATYVVTVNPYPTAPSDTPEHAARFVSAVNGMNTAMINAGNSLAGGHTLLYSFAYWDGSAGYVVAADYTSPPTYYTAATLSHTAIGTPDVAMGNGTSTSANDTFYSVAVAYATTGKVVVDVFTFDAGITTNISTTPASTYTVSVGSPNTVHIDIIADYANPGTGGYADCQYAALTWDDGGQVYAAKLDLLAATGSITGVRGIGTGKDPDVAGIMRDFIGPDHEMGLITYTDVGNDNLYYAEWDILTNGVSSPVTLDAVGGGSAIAIPRIDANDDEATNSSGSYYKVAAEVYNNSTGKKEIRTYDNLLYGLTTYWQSSSVVAMPVSYSSPPLYDHFAPNVAFSGTEYLVSHFTHGGTGDDVVFAEPVDVSVPDVLDGGEYYWVNEDPPLGTSSIYVNASSPNCNNPGATLVAWAYPNGAFIDINYKIGLCCYTGFKQLHLPGAAPMVQEQLRVQPNPANTYIEVSGNTGPGGRYEITDVMGRIWQSGSLEKGSERLNLSRLAAGSYILKLRSADGTQSTKLIIKQ